MKISDRAANVYGQRISVLANEKLHDVVQVFVKSVQDDEIVGFSKAVQQGEAMAKSLIDDEFEQITLALSDRNDGLEPIVIDKEYLQITYLITLAQ